MFIRKWSARQIRCSISRALDDEIIGTTLPEQARGDAKLLKGIGVPDGIRTRVTAVKVRGQTVTARKHKRRKPSERILCVAESRKRVPRRSPEIDKPRTTLHLVADGCENASVSIQNSTCVRNSLRGTSPSSRSARLKRRRSKLLPSLASASDRNALISSPPES